MLNSYIAHVRYPLEENIYPSDGSANAINSIIISIMLKHNLVFYFVDGRDRLHEVLV